MHHHQHSFGDLNNERYINLPTKTFSIFLTTRIINPRSVTCRRWVVKCTILGQNPAKAKDVKINTYLLLCQVPDINSTSSDNALAQKVVTHYHAQFRLPDKSSCHQRVGCLQLFVSRAFLGSKKLFSYF